MTVPQPFLYQGSKRALAPLILQYLPISTTRLVEPFCGSAALSIAAEVTRRRTEARRLRSSAGAEWSAAKARFDQELLGKQ
jgi:site-specific DNA-adenine methylase